jgi:hypothetical protein
MKQFLINILDNKKTSVVLTILAIIVWGTVFTCCTNDEKTEKKVPITLTEIVADNIVTHPNDWIDSSLSETNERLKALGLSDYTQPNIWVNKNCNIKIKSHISKDYYRNENGEETYYGYVILYSQEDTIKLDKNDDIKLLAPVIDTILIQRTSKLEEEKLKLELAKIGHELEHELDSLSKINEIKVRRMAQKFCK